MRPGPRPGSKRRRARGRQSAASVVARRQEGQREPSRVVIAPPAARQVGKREPSVCRQVCRAHKAPGHEHRPGGAEPPVEQHEKHGETQCAHRPHAGKVKQLTGRAGFQPGATCFPGQVARAQVPVPRARPCIIRAMPLRSSLAVWTTSTLEPGSSTQSTATSWTRRPLRSASTVVRCRKTSRCLRPEGRAGGQRRLVGP